MQAWFVLPLCCVWLACCLDAAVKAEATKRTTQPEKVYHETNLPNFQEEEEDYSTYLPESSVSNLGVSDTISNELETATVKVKPKINKEITTILTTKSTPKKLKSVVKYTPIIRTFNKTTKPIRKNIRPKTTKITTPGIIVRGTVKFKEATERTTLSENTKNGTTLPDLKQEEEGSSTYLPESTVSVVVITDTTSNEVETTTVKIKDKINKYIKSTLATIAPPKKLKTTAKLNPRRRIFKKITNPIRKTTTPIPTSTTETIQTSTETITTAETTVSDTVKFEDTSKPLQVNKEKPKNTRRGTTDRKDNNTPKYTKKKNNKNLVAHNKSKKEILLRTESITEVMDSTTTVNTLIVSTPQNLEEDNENENESYNVSTAVPTSFENEGENIKSVPQGKKSKKEEITSEKKPKQKGSRRRYTSSEQYEDDEPPIVKNNKHRKKPSHESTENYNYHESADNNQYQRSDAEPLYISRNVPYYPHYQNNEPYSIPFNQRLAFPHYRSPNSFVQPYLPKDLEALLRTASVAPRQMLVPLNLRQRLNPIHSHYAYTPNVNSLGFNANAPLLTRQTGNMHPNNIIYNNYPLNGQYNSGYNQANQRNLLQYHINQQNEFRRNAFNAYRSTHNLNDYYLRSPHPYGII